MQNDVFAGPAMTEEEIAEVKAWLAQQRKAWEVKLPVTIEVSERLHKLLLRWKKKQDAEILGADPTPKEGDGLTFRHIPIVVVKS